MGVKLQAGKYIKYKIYKILPVCVLFHSPMCSVYKTAGTINFLRPKIASLLTLLKTLRYPCFPETFPDVVLLMG
jgi:hypothetical protein